MLRHEKIAEYIKRKDLDKASEFQSYLNFFIENFNEFENLLENKEKFSIGDRLKKYERLSAYIYEQYNIGTKHGKPISSEVVRNMHNLARKEREASKPKRKLPPEKDTVFRVFHPNDLQE